MELTDIMVILVSLPFSWAMGLAIVRNVGNNPQYEEWLKEQEDEQNIKQ